MPASSSENSLLFGLENQFSLLKVVNSTYFSERQGPPGLQFKCDCLFVEAVMIMSDFMKLLCKVLRSFLHIRMSQIQPRKTAGQWNQRESLRKIKISKACTTSNYDKFHHISQSEENIAGSFQPIKIFAVPLFLYHFFLLLF